MGGTAATTSGLRALEIAHSRVKGGSDRQIRYDTLPVKLHQASALDRERGRAESIVDQLYLYSYIGIILISSRSVDHRQLDWLAKSC